MFTGTYAEHNYFCVKQSCRVICLHVETFLVLQCIYGNSKLLVIYKLLLSSKTHFYNNCCKLNGIFLKDVETTWLFFLVFEDILRNVFKLKGIMIK